MQTIHDSIANRSCCASTIKLAALTKMRKASTTGAAEAFLGVRVR